MSTDPLQQLRGSLQPKGIGARGVAQTAPPPGCSRRALLTILNIPPAIAAREIYKATVREGLSPFALNSGNLFEKHLFEDDAAVLRELYTSSGRLQSHEQRVAMLHLEVPGSSAEALDARQKRTEEYLLRKLRGEPDAPNILIKPRISLELMGVAHPLEPDFLIASDAELIYRVGEAKSYEDRDSKTDADKLKGACEQAAVGAIALQQTLSRLVETSVEIEPSCDLILSRYRGWKATLRPMTIAREMQAVRNVLQGAPGVVAEAQQILGATGKIDNEASLNQIPNDLRPSCRERCALVSVCRRQALAAADPALLGSAAREALQSVGDLQRVLDLIHGKTTPSTPDEQALAAHLKETFDQLTQVIPYAC